MPEVTIIVERPAWFQKALDANRQDGVVELADCNERVEVVWQLGPRLAGTRAKAQLKFLLAGHAILQTHCNFQSNSMHSAAKLSENFKLFLDA